MGDDNSNERDNNLGDDDTINERDENLGDGDNNNTLDNGTSPEDGGAGTIPGTIPERGKEKSWFSRNCKAFGIGGLVIGGLIGAAYLGSATSMGRQYEATFPVEEESYCTASPTTREFELEAFDWGYKQDEKVIDELRVCEGDLVRIILSVEDHDPAGHVMEGGAHGFGIQMNNQFYQLAVGVGETETIEFVVSEAGDYRFFCTVYCGISDDGTRGHHTMNGNLVVLPLDAHDSHDH